MNILQNNLKKLLVIFVLTLFVVNPVFALDFDAVDNSSARKNYSSSSVNNPLQTVQPAQPVQSVQNVVQENVVEQKEDVVPNIHNYEKLPNVPKLPDKAFSKSVAPINTMYTGKTIDKNALVPCNDIKIEELVLEDKYKQKTKFVNVITPKTVSKPKTVAVSKNIYGRLSKGTQFRVVNTVKMSDYMCQGQRIVFKSTQEMKTPYFNVPANTKFIGVIEDVHRPQITCNGGLITIRIVSAEINGYNQRVNASIVKVKTDKVLLGNLKGAHTYFKTTCKKAKWGQKKFKQYSKTSSILADKGAGIVIAPFPYITGCVLACASTLTSPLTALLGKGGNLTIPANTVFTIKLNEDAIVRY